MFTLQYKSQNLHNYCFQTPKVEKLKISIKENLDIFINKEKSKNLQEYKIKFIITNQKNLILEESKV